MSIFRGGGWGGQAKRLCRFEAHHPPAHAPAVLLEAGSYKAKIADFGLAKANRNTVTRGVGTPAFMPPEMFSDEESPEGTNMLAVDIYACGVIFWQLWFRQPPFAGKSVHNVISFVMRGKRPGLEVGRLKGLAPGHPAPPPALRALIERCWAQVAAHKGFFSLVVVVVVVVVGGPGGTLLCIHLKDRVTGI